MAGAEGLVPLTLLEKLNIGEILQPAGRLLVLDQMAAGENVNRLIPVLRRHSLPPRGIEVDTIDGRDDVDTHGWDTDLENQIRTGKVLDRQTVKRSAEGAKGPMHPRRVLRARPNPDIEILGRPNVTVSGQGMSTDHRVSAPAAFNSANRSLKSELACIPTRPDETLEGQPPDHSHSLRRGHGSPILVSNPLRPSAKDASRRASAPGSSLFLRSIVGEHNTFYHAA